MAKKKSKPTEGAELAAQQVDKQAVAASRADNNVENEATDRGAGPVRLTRKVYRKELATLQLDMFAVQRWIAGGKLRAVVMLEGLGPAGKRGTAHRIAEGFDHRVCSVVEMLPPGKQERGQWYFQRYVEHFPTAGKLIILDGGWYHLPATERALGLRSEQEFNDFLKLCAEFERMLVDSGMMLIKYWFSAADEVQDERFRKHIADLVKRKKLVMPEPQPGAASVPVADVRESVFTGAMVEGAPWYLVHADDKRRARLNCMSHLISLAPNADAEGRPEPPSAENDLTSAMVSRNGFYRVAPEVY
jgi:polyphosphate kinase 2 (PPK2 family)